MFIFIPTLGQWKWFVNSSGLTQLWQDALVWKDFPIFPLKCVNEDSNTITFYFVNLILVTKQNLVLLKSIHKGFSSCCFCHHCYCNPTMFLSMQLCTASWLRKVFLYETHFGEVSGMSNKCSKLNLVSLWESTSVQKNNSSTWMTYGSWCARGSLLMCQVFF